MEVERSSFAKSLSVEVKTKQNFSVIEDGFVSRIWLKPVWCPGMDLVAVPTVDNKVVVHRMSLQVLKEIEVDIESPTGFEPFAGPIITCLEWHPSGRQIAVGLTSGCINVYDVEKGTFLYVLTSHTDRCVPVTCLKWILYAGSPSSSHGAAGSSSSFAATAAATTSSSSTGTSTSNGQAGSEPQEEKYIDETSLYFRPLRDIPKPARPGPVTIDRAYDQVLTTGPEKEPLTWLVSGDAQGFVDVHAFGHLLVGSARVASLRGEAGLSSTFTSPLPDLTISQITVAKSMESLCVLVAHPDHPDTGAVVHINTSVYAAQSEELAILSLHTRHISHLVSLVKKTVTSINSHWVNGRRAVRFKFSGIEDSLRDYEEDGDAETALVSLLISGTPSHAMEHFISKYLSVSSLHRMRETTSGLLDHLANITIHNLEPQLEQLIFRLSAVRGFTRWEERFGGTGVDRVALDEMIEAARLMLISTHVLRKTLLHYRTRYDHFFGFINRTICSVAKEEAGTLYNEYASFQYDMLELGDFFAEVLAPTDKLTHLLGKQLLPKHVCATIDKESVLHQKRTARAVVFGKTRADAFEVVPQVFDSKWTEERPKMALGFLQSELEKSLDRVQGGPSKRLSSLLSIARVSPLKLPYSLLPEHMDPDPVVTIPDEFKRLCVPATGTGSRVALMTVDERGEHVVAFPRAVAGTGGQNSPHNFNMVIGTFPVAIPLFGNTSCHSAEVSVSPAVSRAYSRVARPASFDVVDVCVYDSSTLVVLVVEMREEDTSRSPAKGLRSQNSKSTTGAYSYVYSVVYNDTDIELESDDEEEDEDEEEEEEEDGAGPFHVKYVEGTEPVVSTHSVYKRREFPHVQAKSVSVGSARNLMSLACGVHRLITIDTIDEEEDEEEAEEGEEDEEDEGDEEEESKGMEMKED